MLEDIYLGNLSKEENFLRINNPTDFEKTVVLAGVGYSNIEIINILKPLSDLNIQDRNGNDFFLLQKQKGEKIFYCF